jgi:iron complex outermembrane receptor protein
MATTAIALPALPASAQDEAASDAVEEIIVTSRKRSERLQDIPDAVTVFTAETIRNAGIEGIEGALNMAPNVTMTTGSRPGVVLLTIRGMSTAQGGEAPVAIVIDGVQLPSPDFINQELMNVERIEVLRGPQGALYGRGAIGGAINIITKAPTNETEVNGRLSYGNGNFLKASGSVSGAISENKAFYRLSASYRNFDGLIKDVNLDEFADHLEEFTVRGSLKFVASENLTIDLQASYTDSTSGSLTAEVTTTETFDSFEPSQLSRNIAAVDVRDIFWASAKIEYETDAGTLTSITGYNSIDQRLWGDADFSAAPAVAQDWIMDVDAFTEELRFTSPGDQPFRWIVGAFFQDRKSDTFLSIPLDFGGGDIGPSILDNFDVNNSTAWAFFGQANYDISDSLELTLGLRYDEDKRDSTDINVDGSTIAEKFKALQPKVSLAYSWNENFMTYATYARGFRSGGFNPRAAPAQRLFDREISENLELGFKTTMGRFTLNAALFHITFDEQQFFFIELDPPSQNVINIAKTRINGVELELAGNITDNLTISAALGLTDAEIRDFDGLGAFAGNRSPQNYKSTFNVAVQHIQPLSDSLELMTRVDYENRGSVQWDVQNTLGTPSKNYLNARMFLQSETWSIGAYVNNATNEQQPTQAIANVFGPGLHLRIPSARRTYGIEARISY